MRMHAASASDSVTRTLNAIITASGHSVVSEAEAELLLVDRQHPSPTTHSCPQWIVGGDATDAQSIACPIHPRQLLRLIAARLTVQMLPLGHGWTMDLSARHIRHGSAAPIALTEKECALLSTLRQSYPTALDREALLAQVWGITHEIDTHTLETHIYRLRGKLSALTPAPGDILTEDGAYRLIGIDD